MVDISAWFKEDWFLLIQTIGITGGLFFTGISNRQVADAKEMENLLAYAERHRALWSEASSRPELQRIFTTAPNLKVEPPTVAESVFLNVVFVHYELGWRMAKRGDQKDLRPLEDDVRGFFPLPLPYAVWEATQKHRNREFVKFVLRSLGS